MIIERPTWTYEARCGLRQWYGHMQLLEKRALGQWLCLDVDSGTLLWERRYHRPNTVVGVSENVIVATEMRSDGPWTLTFGGYGISLETGELLWTSHAKPRWNGFLRFLDLIPGFTNELRDTPVGVKGSQCACESGRVLDIHTGRQIGKTPHVEAWRSGSSGSSDRQAPAQRLYDTQIAGGGPRFVKIGDGKLLTHQWDSEPPTETPSEQQFRLCLLDARHNLQWKFAIRDFNKYIEGNFFSYRYAGDCVYLIVSDEPPYVPVKPDAPYLVQPNPTTYHLWTLDIGSGAILQKIPVTDAGVTECRIEDLTDDYLLVSVNGKRLLCYQRQDRSG